MQAVLSRQGLANVLGFRDRKIDETTKGPLLVSAAVSLGLQDLGFGVEGGSDPKIPYHISRVSMATPLSTQKRHGLLPVPRRLVPSKQVFVAD